MRQPEESGPVQGSPTSQKAKVESLSTKALAIPFIGRAEELRGALSQLALDRALDTGRSLMIQGDSGTGKSFFVRELLHRAVEKAPDSLCLYIDIANDTFQSSLAIASLLKMSLVAGYSTRSSPINVPSQFSLATFRRSTQRRRSTSGFLRAIAHALAAVVGAGQAVTAALDRKGQHTETLVEDELLFYLRWVAGRTSVVIAVDNFQFLNLDTRLTIESIAERVVKNVRLIVVDRTLGGVSAIAPPVRCFAQGMKVIRLRHMSLDETKKIVATAIAPTDRTESVAVDIFTKTNGLPKDIEFCLRQYVLELGRGVGSTPIHGLISTIDRLPLIHRQFLMIAALLDGGVRPRIARNAVRRLACVYDNAQLDDIVTELVAREYLRINGESGDRLRPGHERIITALRDLSDDELHEDVRRSLLDELALALESRDADESETYVLHCLVGLQTAHELAQNLHYVTRLIESQYRNDHFSYLVSLSDELHEILPLLPEHALNNLLDAMQKSAAFDRGLQLVQLLDLKGVPGAPVRRIYRLKYLTQAYRYEEALSLSRKLGDEEWAALYRINALMALQRDDEARGMATREFGRPLSEAQAVLYRNTVTLFDGDTALRNLGVAYQFFDRRGSEFRLATVDTNRGLVYLHLGRLGDARRVLERALRRMQRVGSREIYQAHVNLGVLSALIGEYDAALDHLEEAAVIAPRSLLLDHVKIDMNRTVVRCISGGLGAAEARRSFNSGLSRIRGIEMPYIREAMEHNMAIACGNRTTVRRGDFVSLVMPIASASNGGEWCLMMSVHWRY